MVESSRSFLFTEYARGGCGTFHDQGTDPKVWDVLPVSLVPYNLTCFYSANRLCIIGQILRLSWHPRHSSPGQGRQSSQERASRALLQRRQTRRAGQASTEPDYQRRRRCREERQHC